MYDKERTRTGENSSWTIVIGTIFGRMATSISIAFLAIYLTLVIIIITFTIGEVLLFSMMDLFVDRIAKPELKGTYLGAIGFSQLGNAMGLGPEACVLMYLDRADPASFFLFLPASR